jgi:hypothetical protein
MRLSRHRCRNELLDDANGFSKRARLYVSLCLFRAAPPAGQLSAELPEAGCDVRARATVSHSFHWGKGDYAMSTITTKNGTNGNHYAFPAWNIRQSFPHKRHHLKRLSRYLACHEA